MASVPGRGFGGSLQQQIAISRGASLSELQSRGFRPDELDGERDAARLPWVAGELLAPSRRAQRKPRSVQQLSELRVAVAVVADQEGCSDGHDAGSAAVVDLPWAQFLVLNQLLHQGTDGLVGTDFGSYVIDANRHLVS